MGGIENSSRLEPQFGTGHSTPAGSQAHSAPHNHHNKVIPKATYRRGSPQPPAPAPPHPRPPGAGPPPASAAQSPPTCPVQPGRRCRSRPGCAPGRSTRCRAGREGKGGQRGLGGRRCGHVCTQGLESTRMQQPQLLVPQAQPLRSLKLPAPARLLTWPPRPWLGCSPPAGGAAPRPGPCPAKEEGVGTGSSRAVGPGVVCGMLQTTTCT